jgi:hypothetical protein
MAKRFFRKPGLSHFGRDERQQNNKNFGPTPRGVARAFLFIYKDPGGPAQLGTRDWAGLKGHGADRDLARYGGQKRAAPGEGISHVRRHRRAPKGRSWVGYNSV